ncbi:MAG: peptidase [Gammaproteobacteria bacterium]|nr:MAG: peptidase [Gammaproteobacteria bacterium]
MNKACSYKVGVTGQKWDEAEKLQWLALQTIKRSYKTEVLDKLTQLGSDYHIEQYGALAYNRSKYPLYAVKSLNFDVSKKTILVTGGVHGYETSGVQGALRFLVEEAKKYQQFFNIIVVPCISPWGYETINRWNYKAIDPNRSFYENSLAEEAANIIAYIKPFIGDIIMHIDLHETTDTDNSEFRPALAARDAVSHDNWNIPDGFYLVGDTLNPQKGFQKAIIDSVSKVTHIAPADENGKLIGTQLEQNGVINYANKTLGLCAGLSNAKYVTTTEVYPDSPKVNDENCIIAQVAAITGALEYVLNT